MGVDGLIFWSSSNNMTQRCDTITNFLQTTLGPKEWDFDEICQPYIANITEYTDKFGCNMTSQRL
ncbi:hypothetical protein COOONC_25796 [Cooperia oncophora]